MAFDSNPMAIYHGEGYGELRQIGQATFNMSSASNSVLTASSTGSITVANIVDRLAFVHISGTAGTDDKLYAVNFNKIRSQEVVAGTDTGSATNSVVLDITEEQVFLSRGSGTHLVIGSSDVATVLGAGNVTVTVYEVY